MPRSASLVGSPLLRLVLDAWHGSETLSRNAVLAIAVAVAAAAAWKLFHSVRGGRWFFAGGLAGGLLLLLVLR